MPEVIIDGVRYAPVNTVVADGVRFYYMHDNHTFTRLKGDTLEEVLAHADSVEEEDGYGMLCPAIVMAGNKELRRVGPGVHSYGKNDKQDRWGEGKKAWLTAISEDLDIPRLLAFGAGNE